MKYLLILISLSPFIGTFGSNTGIAYNGILFLSFIMTLIIITDYFDIFPKRNLSLIILIFYIFSLIFFADGFLLHPYNQKSLFKQNYQLNFNNIEPDLMLDLERKNYVEEIQNIFRRNGFKNGDPILGVYEIPGLIYLLGGISPGGILWNEEFLDMFFYNLNQSKFSAKDCFLIIEKADYSKFEDKLKYMGISLKNDYNLIGDIRNYLKTKTLLYAPKR